MPVLAAGGTFAVCSLAGLAGGLLLAQRTGQQLWVAGGLFVGLALGGYSAFALLRKSM
jgi:hypothetical protein